MQNLSIIDKKHINRIFDLKGSEIDRITKNVEKVDRMVALKEAEFLWMKKVHNVRN